MTLRQSVNHNNFYKEHLCKFDGGVCPMAETDKIIQELQTKLLHCKDGEGLRGFFFPAL